MITFSTSRFTEDPVLVAFDRGAARTRWRLTLLLLFLLCSSGCATIISGTTERIRFESTPPGAQLTVDGRRYTTPAEVELRRLKNHDAEFVLPEYLPVQRQVLRTTNAWVYGNILIGGLIGLMVDFANGAANDLAPDVVRVQLVRQPMATKPESPPNGAPSEPSPAAEPPPPH